VTRLVSHWLLLNCVVKKDLQSKSMERVNIYTREEERGKKKEKTCHNTTPVAGNVSKYSNFIYFSEKSTI